MKKNIFTKLKYYFYYEKEKINHNRLMQDKSLFKSAPKTVSAEAGNARLKELIRSGKSFSVIRYGCYELYEFFYFGRDLLFGTHKHLNEEGIVNAKNFHSLGEGDPEGDLGFKKFFDYNVSATENADIIINDNTMQGIEFFLNVVCKKNKNQLYSESMVNALDLKDSWTKELKGKKVLVVSPFAEAIEEQYKNRDKLFKDPDFLPEFELHTVKSIWFFTGSRDSRFKTWWDALDYMYEESMKQDFDIALLGCGPFGIPLIDMYKKQGKSGIYVGGILQMFFGIRGARWDDTYGHLYNDYWISPPPADKPEGSEVLDNSCYW